MADITIRYLSEGDLGEFRRLDGVPDSVWLRTRSASMGHDADAEIRRDSIRLGWPELLNVLRELAPLQRQLGFRFLPVERAADLVRKFVSELKKVREASGGATSSIAAEEIDGRLETLGWDPNKRRLKSFQRRDLAVLASLPNGANFSVPGSGKTTVTLALNLLTKRSGDHLLVVAPKNAFGAWKTVIRECLRNDDAAAQESFCVLGEGGDDVYDALNSGRTRFLISYDQLVKHQNTLAGYLARHVVHFIVDEAHRMKAGIGSQRGAALLRMAALCARRDILTGTPMPQSPVDLKPQLDFLWPGSGLGLQIEGGRLPRDVIAPLYVRTTKKDLGLPPATRTPRFVDMSPAHQAFYSLVKSVSLQQLSGFRTSSQVDVVRARHCVMRLLQVSSNPILAIGAMSTDVPADKLNPLIRAVVDEGISAKLRDAIQLARTLAAARRKVLVWTIFRENVSLLEQELADLNPVVIDGSVPSGDFSDLSTREGRVQRFHTDQSCMVMIANPAAASEGMSVHEVCHDAIYVDRSYNATHYLQSLDRIHRLGIGPETTTTAHLLFNRTPLGIGSIDYSVSRRLAGKIRQMQQTLDDVDLHEIALDEESIPPPVDSAVTIQDLVDLVEELEGRRVFDPATDLI